MRVHAIFKSVILALFVGAAAGCGAGKTEALPDGGGELAKAYEEMTAAFKAGDRERAAKLLNDVDRYTNGVDGSGLVKYVENLSKLRPIGGRRQGERAALFLETSNQAANKPQRPALCYQTLDATHTADGWRFDDMPAPAGCEDEGRLPVCPRRAAFPCSVTTAPDSQVSGSIHEHGGRGPERTVSMLDGFGVRMIDYGSNRLKSTRVVLTTTGIVPQNLAYSAYPDRGNLLWMIPTTLVLDVAPDGKGATATYWNPWEEQNLDLSDGGLTIDGHDADRMRGRLRLDKKAIGAFDIVFDVATRSECGDQYGNSCQ